MVTCLPNLVENKFIDQRTSKNKTKQSPQNDKNENNDV